MSKREKRQRRFEIVLCHTVYEVLKIGGLNWHHREF